MMKKILLLLSLTIASQAMAKDTITVLCNGRLNELNSFGENNKNIQHKIELDILKNDDNDPGYISNNGIMTFPDGYEVVYNINVELGKASLFGSNEDTTSEIRARLQRHTGGNGKIVLGASRLKLNQKAKKSESKIAMDIVNVRALDEMVNTNDIRSLDEDPILFQSHLKEAVFTGMFDKGVVKSAQIECSTL